MFNKTMCCFKNYLNINQEPYLQVQNVSSVYISFLLQYNVGSTGFTKQSPVFGPGQTQRLTFPNNCSDLYFEIYNNYYYPRVLVCHKGISLLINTFYQLVNNSGHLQCIQVDL